MASPNPPLYEFKGERLAIIGTNQFPSYYDSLNKQKPYAYFSAYGSNSYDPNDVDYAEPDPSGLVTAMARAFQVNFPVQSNAMNSGYATPTSIAYSPAPNPYTLGQAAPATLTTVITTPTTYQNPQSFQIISAGYDGVYGVGGQFDGSSTSALPLPVDSSNINSTSPTIRQYEADNITNIKNGTLQ